MSNDARENPCGILSEKRTGLLICTREGLSLEILPGGETRLEALHVSPLQGPYDHKVPTGFAVVGELKLYGQGGIRSAALLRGAPRGLRPS